MTDLIKKLARDLWNQRNKPNSKELFLHALEQVQKKAHQEGWYEGRQRGQEDAANVRSEPRHSPQRVNSEQAWTVEQVEKWANEIFDEMFRLKFLHAFTTKEEIINLVVAIMNPPDSDEIVATPAEEKP